MDENKNDVELLLDDLNILINNIYDDIIVEGDAGLVEHVTKNKSEEIFKILNKVAKKQTELAFKNFIINMSSILSKDKNGININKLINKVQSKPKNYGLKENDANELYEKWQECFNVITESEVYKNIKEVRDKIIAHKDLNSKKIHITFPSGSLEILLSLVNGFCNYVFLLFHREQNVFSFNDRASIYKLYLLLTPPSKKKAIN